MAAARLGSKLGDKGSINPDRQARKALSLAHTCAPRKTPGPDSGCAWAQSSL